MAGNRKLFWMLAAMAGAGAVLVLRTPDDAPAHPGRAATETAGYPRAADGPVPFSGIDRATGPAPTGLSQPGQGASSPPRQTAPLAAAETSAGLADELLLSPEASAAVTGSSAPGAETIDVGAFLDPEGHPIEDDKVPVSVGDYLDPDSASNSD